MLYVYQVDTGTMLTFDMNLAMESVSKLQQVIAKTCKISEDKQVLLISGGENLDPNARVCSYSAGTDTNPIFLFSKSTIEAATPPSASVNYGSEADLKDQVDGALGMPPTYDTVVVRAQLSLQFHDVAKDELRICERLVHDQHLQHQGWAAVVANLEDITSAFRSRAEVFKKNVDDYIHAREAHISMLTRFPNQVQLLSRIPILPCLLQEMQAMEEEEEESESDSWGLSHKPKSLLDWISAQDSRNTLDQMAQQCQLGIDQFDEKLRDSLVEEVYKIIESTDNPRMKEVKGLEDRLSGLEQLMFGARKLVQEQSDMAQGFVQNQNRARTLSDPSVLPDLCNVHRGQLFALLKNHQSMRDIKRRCTLAKEELSVNLHTRLRWVMYVEKSICDVDSKLVIHHETMKKLKRKLEIIQQMASAPELYCGAVVEVVRRKKFTHHFLEWAGSLAEESSQIHNVEVEKREEFLSQLKHHFLRSLFPGIEDTPPPFATKPPVQYDDLLPAVTADDIEFLKSEVPELAERLKIPDEENLPVHKHSSTSTLQATPSHLLTIKPEGLCALQDLVTSDIVVLNHEEPGDGEEQLHTAYFSTSQRPEEAEQGDDVSHSVEVIVQDDAQFNLRLSEADPPGSLGAIAAGKAEAKRDTCHSAESPEGGPPTKIEKRDSKSAAGTSPDHVDEDSPSGGFATADFYIDESMPSSMTESAPTKKIAELQLVILEKNALIESRDREIEGQRATIDDLKPKLASVEDCFKQLQDVSEKGALQLRCDLLSMAGSFQKDKDEFQSFCDTIVKRVLDSVTVFEERQTQIRDASVDKLKLEHDSTLQQVRNELEVATQKLDDAHKEIDIYHRNLDEKCVAYDTLKEEHETRIAALTKENDDNLQMEKNQLVLEHEVELEKVRSELEEEIAESERKITDLQTSIEEMSKRLEKAQKEHQILEGNLRQEYQQEKDQVLKILEQDFADKKKKHEKETEEKYENLTAEKQKEIEKAFEEKHEKMLLELEEKQTQMLTELRAELENEQEKILAYTKTSVRAEMETKLSQAEAEQSERHESEIRVLKAGFEQEMRELETKHEQEIAQNSTTESESDSISLHRHQELLTELRVAMETEKEQAVEEILETGRRDRKAAEEEMTQKAAMDKQVMRTSMVAEKQVIFNEALNKVVEEKEKIIEELKQKERSLLEEREKDKALIQTLQSPDGVADPAATHDKDREARMIQQRLEEELGLAKHQILHLQSQIHQQGGGMGSSMALSSLGHSSLMGASVMPLTDPNVASRVHDLESNLRSKEDEVAKLQQKIMEMSMTADSRAIIQDKVSITTCNIGDIVLLCLDERHDHYVVFTVGTTLHFLHSDCLEHLGLKTSPGEHRKSWVLAEIVDKEYCQAKKAQNRFKVPIGTKFYRVKAKAWSRGEGAHQAASDTGSPR